MTPNQTLERMTTAFTVFFEAGRLGRGSHALSFSLGRFAHRAFAASLAARFRCAFVIPRHRALPPLARFASGHV